MFRRIAVVAVWAFLLSSAFAQQPNSGWIRYSNDPGRFSVLLPTSPEEGTSEEKNVTLHTFTLKQTGIIYLIVFSDYPDADLKLDMDTRLAGERDAFLKTLNATLISEKRFTASRGAAQIPATEFTADNPSGTFKCKVFIDGRRMYMLGIGNRKGVDSAAEAARFLDSFQLTE